MPEWVDDLIDRWANPATLRGVALIGAGAMILAFPDASAQLVRLVVAVALVVIGCIDVWSAIRSDRSTWHGLLTGLATIVAGLATYLFVGNALRSIVVIGAVVLAVRGALIAARAVAVRRTSDTWVFDLVRGLLFAVAGVILAFVPDALLDGVLIVTALVAIGFGAVIVGFGFTNPDEGEMGTAELGGLVVRWFRQRDAGDATRAEVVDALFFEQPGATQKQIGFWTLLVLSVVIATLGILADSTAVVIGAMLVAPLMTPIMGVSAGIVNGWVDRVFRSLATVGGGVAVAVAVAWIVAVWTPRLVPLAQNAQILTRTSPTLIDLMIAVAAGAAGAYATVDTRVSSSITGVAIAVALVPPLGVVGVMLHATAWSDALGAFLLFLTNLVSIILTASIVFVVMGLAPFADVRRNQAEVRTVVVTVLLGAIVIIVPLAFTSQGILASATRQSEARETVETWLEDSTLELERVSVDGSEVDIRLSGEGEVPSVPDLEQDLQENLDSDVVVQVEYFPSRIITSDDA